MADDFKAGRKIDVEESKKQGRIVTKEVDEKDPDYYKYKQAGTIKEEDEGFHLGGLSNEEITPPKGIEMYYFYLYFLFLFIPVSFVVLKAFLIGGNLEIGWKIFAYISIVVGYVLGILIFPIFILKRKDVSITHRKRIKILMGNNIVLLMWLTVFVITPIMADITIPSNKAKLTFLLFFIMFIFDVGIQMILQNIKTKNPSKTELCERISLILSILAIWGYGAIICPLIFSKISERIIFDITLLVVVTIISITNLVVYKFKKNVEEIDYEYSSKECHNAHKLLIHLIIEGIGLTIACIVIICI